MIDIIYMIKKTISIIIIIIIIIIILLFGSFSHQR